MARYYLHLRDFLGGVLEDEDGCEFLNLAAARKEAVVAMRDFVGAAIRHGDEPPFEAITITDEQGVQLAAIPLIAALPHTVVELLTQPEKVVLPGRLEEYRRHAAECREKAENASDTDDKMAWLELANAWLRTLPQTHATGGEPSEWPVASDEDFTASH